MSDSQDELDQPRGLADGREDGFLHLYWSAIARRWKLVLGTTAIAAALAAAKTYTTSDVYEATAQILIEPGVANVLDFKDATQFEAAKEEGFQGQLKLLQSRQLARRALEDSGLLQEPEFGGPLTPEQLQAAKDVGSSGETPVVERAVSSLLSRVSVKVLRPSRHVQLSVRSGRAEVAARAANGMAKALSEQVLDKRSETSAEVGTWLKDQIEEQRAKVEETERKLKKLAEDLGTRAADSPELLDQRIKDLAAKLNELRTDRLQKEVAVAQMQAATNPLELPEVTRSPVISSILQEEATLQGRLAELQERFLPEHPEVVKVTRQIEAVRKRALNEAQTLIRVAQNDHKAALAQERAMGEALDQAKAEKVAAPSTARFDSLKTELEAARTLLNNMLTKEKQTDVSGSLRTTNIRVVDPALVPKAPVLPNRPRDIGLGVVLGLALGMALTLLLEYLDNTVKTPEDVRRHLGIPLLGVIPEQKSEKGVAPALSVIRNGATPFAEGYRVLRTALNYSWPEHRSRVILVTSTLPGEGKTLTSVNIAGAFATSDAKVLLIDADMRKPQAHAVLGVKRTPGLSDVLVGRSKPSEAIQAIPNSTLSFLSAGTMVPSPADLMSRAALEGLLGGLRGLYTHIIVDSPPVAAVADALVLSALSDGIILVVGAEMVPRKGVLHTVERLNEAGVRILGAVLNRARLERQGGYYGRYYGHYYGHYGQYYGQREKTPAETRPRVAQIDRARSQQR